MPHYYQIVEMGGPRRFGGPDPVIHGETDNTLLVNRMMDMMRAEDRAHRARTGWPKFVGLSVLEWWEV